MSGDETFVLILGGALAAFGWTSWYISAGRVQRLSAPHGGETAVLIAPPVAALVLLAVLVTAASRDVRDAPIYIGMYFALGATWLWVGLKLLPLFGLSARDDVFERGNPAAAYAIAGALIGIMLCFAGGNIGDGPGWWVVVFCGALASWSLFLCWAVLERVSGVSDVVTVERDVAAGLRLGALLVALGLIFGRAVAGNWWSASATLRDFALLAWPALVLLAAAILVEQLSRPTPTRPAPSLTAFGVLPALGYLGVAAAYVVSVSRAA